MGTASTLRHFFVTALLFGVVLLCLSHTGSRLSRWAEGETWPAELVLPQYEPIGDYARDSRGGGELGLRLDGLSLLEGSANELNRFLFRVQHVIVPSVLVRSPRERTLVVASPEAARSNQALRAEGWADAQTVAVPDASGSRDTGRQSTIGSLTLVDRAQELREHPDARTRKRPTWIGALFLLVALGVPPVVASRRGWIPFGLTLVGTPCALGIAAAVGDLTTTPGPITLLVHALLSLIWIRCVTPLADAYPARAGRRQARAVSQLSFVVAATTTALFSIALLVLFAGLAPEGGWDAQAMYNMRGRFILVAEPFLAPFSDAEGYRELHPDYPPLVPFAVAGVWRLGDGMWPLAPLLLQAQLALGATVLIAVWARRNGGRLAALSGLALLAVSPFWLERTSAQECDVPLAVLFVCAVVVWRLGQASASTAHVRRGAFVCGTLVGLATLVKNEGAVFAAVWSVLVLAQSVRKPRIPVGRPSGLAAYLGGLLLPLTLFGTFTWVTPTNDLVSSFDPARASLERAATIGRHVAPLLWRPFEFKSVFALVALPASVSFFIGLSRWWRRRRDGTVFEASLATVLVVLASVYAVAYLITPYDLEWHLRTSASRVLLHLYPLAVVLGLSMASRGLREQPAASSAAAS